MNYRECRHRAMYEIFKVIDNNINIQKTFLLLGGMKNAVYCFNGRGIKILGLSGCGEVNCPGVFELLEIDYSIIPTDQFLEEYNNYNNCNENLYVIPAVREMLNTDSVDLKNFVLVGHSFFIVDSVKDEKIYFKTIGNNQDYYMHLNVFHQVNNAREWIMEGDFEVYKISINELKSNEHLRRRMDVNEYALFEENVNTFLDNTKIVGDEGTIRLEGEQAYDCVIQHLQAMKNKLYMVKDTEEYYKFIKYVYIQLANFRKYIAAGSDGYYRTEFCEMLSNIVNLPEHKNYWESIVQHWRIIGRFLVQITSLKYLEKNGIEALEKLITQWETIKKIEIEGIRDLIKELKLSANKEFVS